MRKISFTFLDRKVVRECLRSSFRLRNSNVGILRAISNYSSDTELNPVRENIRKLNVDCAESVRKVLYSKGLDSTVYRRGEW